MLGARTQKCLREIGPCQATVQLIGHGLLVVHSFCQEFLGHLSCLISFLPSLIKVEHAFK